MKRETFEITADSVRPYSGMIVSEPEEQVKELYTERLVLRPLVAADSSELFAARGDAEVMAHWDWPPDANSDETAAVTEILLTEMRSGAFLYWTIRLRADGAFVGVCDLSEIQSGVSADVGFMLLRKFWGQGLAGEIVGCLLSKARSLGLRVVTARIHSANARSKALLLKAGFRVVDEIPRYEIRPGVFRDCLRFETSVE